MKQLTVTSGGDDQDEDDQDEGDGTDGGGGDSGGGNGGGATSTNAHWMEQLMPIINQVAMQALPAISVWSGALMKDASGRRYAETGGRLEDLRPKTCEQLYREMVKTCAVDTHRNALAVAKTFGAWCVKQGTCAGCAADQPSDEPTTAATGTTTAPRKLARRGSGMAAETALRVVRGEPDNAGATAAEPTSSGDYVGNGQ